MADNDETPTIAELAEQLRDEYRDLTDWRVYENDVHAQVFEFEKHRRMQVWDEADFMGTIDGYSWQEQLWTGSEWVDVTEISTENEIPPLSVQELRAHLDAFRIEAEATRPDTLTPREASLDRLARSALGASARMSREVVSLQGKLREADDRLHDIEADNSQTRAALVALGNRLGARRLRSDGQTGPVASPSRGATAHGPDL